MCSCRGARAQGSWCPRCTTTVRRYRAQLLRFCISATDSSPSPYRRAALYWDDPFTFDPSRFIDTPTYKYNRDAFCPFSGGPRQCMGQKFAQVEMVAIVATLLARYSIEIPDAQRDEYALRAGETERDRRERVFQIQHGLTLTPGVLPLVFKRRE